MTDLDTEAVKEQLEDLQDAIEDLKSTLLPLNIKASSTIDSFCEKENYDAIARSKILVTMGYAIDSLMFSYLKLTGVKTENHSIMHELDRIKQYIMKIKAATTQRKVSLNKAAANRVIGHDLSGNAAVDRERAKKTSEINQRIQDKLANITTGRHTRFTNSALSQPPTETLVNGVSSVADETAKPDANEKKAVHTMFEETRAERKARERRERRIAKKARMKKRREKAAEEKDEHNDDDNDDEDDEMKEDE